jgi:hypothetical protein
MSIQSFPSRASLSIPDAWQLMATETSEGPMVLKVNSGYADLIGHPEYPYQVGVAVPLNAPNSAGFHDDEEGVQVGVIEDLLVQSLQSENLALWVFSQCSSGHKEWVFYTGDPTEAGRRIHEIRNRVTTHEIQNIFQPDPEWEIFQAFTGITSDESEIESADYPNVLKVTLNEFLAPFECVERYESHINERLAELSLGKVTLGGLESFMKESLAELEKAGVVDSEFAARQVSKIESVQLEISVADIEAALPEVIGVLEERGAPKGSRLFFEQDGVEHLREFGRMEGVSLSLDASLPEELWDTYAEDVCPAINEILERNGAGEVHSVRDSEDVTELFMYGPNASKIREAIADFQKTFPLCENSKIVDIGND